MSIGLGANFHSLKARRKKALLSTIQIISVDGENYCLKENGQLPSERIFAKHPSTGEIFLLLGASDFKLFVGKDGSHLQQCKKEIHLREKVGDPTILSFFLNKRRIVITMFMAHPNTLFYSDNYNLDPTELINHPVKFIK